MPDIESDRPPWLSRLNAALSRKWPRPDFIARSLTKGEMHAYHVALLTAYRLSLSGGRLLVR